jgi:hypothetical protein
MTEKGFFLFFITIGLIFILLTVVFGEYIVWDKHDECWRDYGTITNYAYTMANANDRLMEGVIKITNTVTLSVRSNVYIEVEKECESSFWEIIDFPAGISIGALILFLLL